MEVGIAEDGNGRLLLVVRQPGQPWPMAPIGGTVQRLNTADAGNTFAAIR